MLGKRKLGSQGLEVSEIGLGCMGMSHGYGVPDDAESIKTIHRAIELGCTFLDTAEFYGPYINEELLGRALAGKRNKVIVATKFGFNIVNGKSAGFNSHPDHIRKTVDESLKRLSTDYIDLLYQHRVDPAVPIEDVAGAVKELVDAGKVRFFGLSEAGTDIITRAHKIQPVSAIQSEYSLWERNLEKDIIPLLRKLEIGLVAFGPLGKGFFAGKPKRAAEYDKSDFRQYGDPRIRGGNYDKNVQKAEAVSKLAQTKGYTAAQISIAWLLHKGTSIVPIPGTKRRKYLEENLKAAAVALTPSDMEELDSLFSDGATAGQRYDANMMSQVNR